MSKRTEDERHVTRCERHQLSRLNAEKYEAWYQTPRGHWISSIEFSLMMKLLQPSSECTLLDVGCGTGHFSRLFSKASLKVTGTDINPEMLRYAHHIDDRITYIAGTMLRLPFIDRSFDYCAAVTSLCFIEQPVIALREMWRMCRKGMVIGLLNRNSFLYKQKHGRGDYQCARWDTAYEARAWLQQLDSEARLRSSSAVWLPSGGLLSRSVERLLPGQFYGGGFLALVLLR